MLAEVALRWGLGAGVVLGLASCGAAPPATPTKARVPALAAKPCGGEQIARAERWLREGRLERVLRVASTPPAGCDGVPESLLRYAAEARSAIRSAARGEDAEKLYLAALAARQRNDPSAANRLLAAALLALEQRARAKVQVAAGGALRSHWYRGPLPAGAPLGPRGALLVETPDAVLVVDAASGLELLRIDAPSPWLVSPDQAWLVAGADATTKLWSLREQREVAALGGAEQLSFDPRSKLLAWVVRQHEVEVLDLPTLARRSLFRAPPSKDPDADQAASALQKLSFSPDGSVLALRSYDAKLRLIDVASGQLRLSADTTELLSFAAVAFSADSRWCAWSGPKGLEALDLRNGRRVHARLAFRVSALGFHPQGEEVAVGGERGQVVVYDLKTGRTRTLARGSSGAYEETTGSFTSFVEYTPDPSHLVYGVGAGSVMVDAKNGAELRWPGCSPEPASTRGARVSWGWTVPDRGCAPAVAPTVWSRSGRFFQATSVGSGIGPLVDWPARKILWTGVASSLSYAFSDDERVLATDSAHFDTSDGHRLPAPRLGSAAGSVDAIRFDAQGVLYFAADFGRGTEACSLSPGSPVACEWGRALGDAVLGRRPLFHGYRTLSWHGESADQKEELRKPDGQLVASGDVSTSFAAPPSSELIASVSTDVQLLDGSGKLLWTPALGLQNAAAAFDRRSERMAVWAQSAKSAELRVFELHGRRQLLAKSLPRLATERPVGFAAGGSRLAVAEPGHVRWLELPSGRVLASVDVPDLALFAASETEALLLTATVTPGPTKGTELSRVRVFDLGTGVPRQLYELSLPRLRQAEWAPGSKGWLAVTSEGLTWVERNGARQAKLDAFPTGIAARWSDGTVDLHPGASSWLMCEAKSFALPAEACADRFAALDAPDPDGPRPLW